MKPSLNPAAGAIGSSLKKLVGSAKKFRMPAVYIFGTFPKNIAETLSPATLRPVAMVMRTSSYLPTLQIENCNKATSVFRSEEAPPVLAAAGKGLPHCNN